MRSSRACRPRSAQPSDRNRADDLRVHGQAPHAEHPREAGAPFTTRGRGFLSSGERRSRGGGPTAMSTSGRRQPLVAVLYSAAPLPSVELFGEMTAVVDERTLEILDHRRRTAVVRRRGWLVRRMLLLADVLGLAGAFLLAEVVTAAAAPGPDRVARSTEFIVF